jgi:hypothetical protein
LSWEKSKEGRKDFRDLIAKSDSENELLASKHLQVQDALKDYDDDEILPEQMTNSILLLSKSPRC